MNHNTSWMISMDTSVLLCYFAHFGYHMTSNQCDNQNMNEFKSLVDGKKKIILKECKSQFDILFNNSFPNSFSLSQKNKKQSKSVSMKCDGTRSPPEILSCIDDVFNSEFEPCKCEGSIKSDVKKTDMRRDTLRYIRTTYVNNPTSDESQEWIYIKRHSIPDKISVSAYGSKKNADRQKLEYLLKKMRKGKDLDMLVQLLFYTKKMDRHVLFISEDYDHMIPKNFLWGESDHRLFVMSVNNMIKHHEIFPLKNMN